MARRPAPARMTVDAVFAATSNCREKAYPVLIFWTHTSQLSVKSLYSCLEPIRDSA